MILPVGKAIIGCCFYRKCCRFFKITILPLTEKTMLKNQKALYPYLVFLMISVCLFFLISCGGKKTLTSDQDQASQNDTLTENTYRKVIIQNFEADQNLIKRHPNAAVLCKEATFQELLKIGTIPMIVKTVSASLRETNTIIIKVHLAYLSETQQIRGQTKTGPAKMTAQLRLIDASNGKAVHEKNLSIADQPSIKSTSNASELGKLIARHVSKVVRSK
jgi:hypothetical protein